MFATHPLNADDCRDVALARTGAADQDNVLCIFHELSAVQLPDSGLVDLAGFEVEACEVFVRGEARHLGVIGDWGMAGAILIAR